MVRAFVLKGTRYPRVIVASFLVSAAACSATRSGPLATRVFGGNPGLRSAADGAWAVLKGESTAEEVCVDGVLASDSEASFLLTREEVVICDEFVEHPAMCPGIPVRLRDLPDRDYENLLRQRGPAVEVHGRGRVLASETRPGRGTPFSGVVLTMVSVESARPLGSKDLRKLKEYVQSRQVSGR